MMNERIIRRCERHVFFTNNCRHEPPIPLLQDSHAVFLLMDPGLEVAGNAQDGRASVVILTLAPAAGQAPRFMPKKAPFMPALEWSRTRFVTRLHIRALCATDCNLAGTIPPNPQLDRAQDAVVESRELVLRARFPESLFGKVPTTPRAQQRNRRRTCRKQRGN